MAERIEIFGKVLELDDARLVDIIIHRKVKEIASKVAKETEALFTKEKNPETMVSISDTVVKSLMINGVFECKHFLEKFGLDDVENKEIFVTTAESSFIEEWRAFEDAYIRARAINDEAELKRLQRVYKSKDFISGLGRAMYMDVYGWIPNIEKLILYRDIPLKVITLKDEEKGVGLFKLLKQNPNYELAYRLLETDPSELEYYEYCMIKFPEQIEALVALQHCIGYEPAKSIIEKGLKALFEKMRHDTEEETLILKEKLDSISKATGISESDTIIKVDKMLVQFDIAARTFQNIEFATRELRRKAEADYQELSQICEGLEKFDENSCIEHKEIICERDYVQEIANLFLQKIEERKTTIWKEEDAVKFEKVFLKTNINDEKSIKNSVSEIERIGRTDDKTNYINALMGMSAENRELFTKYNEWKEKKFLQKYLVQVILWFAGVIGMYLGVGFFIIIIPIVFTVYKYGKNSKMKTAWETLTLNGKLVHPQLLSQNISINDMDKLETDKEKMPYKPCGEEANPSALEDDNVNHPSTSAIANGEVMFCKYCGKQIARTAKFCNFCGTKVTCTKQITGGKENEMQ